MLALTDVNSFYGASHILHDVSVAIEPHKILAILGRNGVGKTTLLKTIMGLTDKATGTMILDGVDVSETVTHERAWAGIGYVPQGRQIIPDFSIKENILMGGFATNKGAGRVPDIVAELFPYLIENLDRPGGVLSGGQQQQLAIARALAMDPKVLLLDEPTEGIQPNIVEQIEQTIIHLNKELNLTIILVEQNVRFAREAADHFTMMENGRVVEFGDVAELSDEIISKHMTI